MSEQQNEIITPDLKAAIKRLSHACGEALAAEKALRVAGLSAGEAEAPMLRKITTLKQASMEVVEILAEDYEEN